MLNESGFHRTDAGDVSSGLWQDWIHHRDVLRGRAMRLTHGNVQEAEDILSSTILKAVSHVQHHHTVIREPRAFFLYALNNEFISHRRRQANERHLRDFQVDVHEDQTADLAGSAPSEERMLQAQEMLDATLHALDLLPPPYHALFRMRFYEEQSYADIAAALHISEALVRKRIQLLREKLRHMVKPAA